jgi:formylglycine-generating enzyme required for sulfatase activity
MKKFPAIAIFAAAVSASVALAQGFSPAPPRAGTVFKDCPECPEMVVIPAGAFIMGDLAGDGPPLEAPAHRVVIAKPFAVGKFEVTFAEWYACVAAEGCDGYDPDDAGWGQGRRPVVNISWNDATAYAQWLSLRTGKPYRLLSEAEWEYAARARSTARYPWGDDIDPTKAKYDSTDGTVPVGSYPANAFGLHDMIGNAWEWTEDCWHDNYDGAPTDGSAWMSTAWWHRVLRGGNWYFDADHVRSASRDGEGTGSRFDLFGFRVARSID